MNKDYLKQVPLIAIIRGVKPSEVLAVTQAIYDGGIRCVEVPLNSPRAYESIKLIADKFGDKMLLGAGTVLSIDQVQKVKEAGGEIIVSPNVNSKVIKETKKLAMLSYPGIMTMSEAFMALEAGADALKLFPADSVGKSFIKASKAVLPKGTEIYAVGGVDLSNVKDWTEAGADGFGLGGSLYKPGKDLSQLAQDAQSFCLLVK
ncbi:2-dehydro-3-deoxy-6-phosphogalactonate aldolase [Lentisphaera profundi]|uniref:2-dehydro-3-deoxy-6-phosphogalactonate aldolase n=1 Tax=Lentisphaera profundi TaxID=1658616 RepID=A0ABY7W2A9_9BACT|nr:2-dehydro-3-deoxy-6-phosphogalactonate aldolase [Lentisphaera profundi]WDE99252.1 2-dehydro-3-deoxy-6-phosphogalactonate aldolase [Lentisphaera profundi]